MNLIDLKAKIKEYKPCNEQEEKDKQIMIKYINTFDDILTRENEFAHFTASNWVVNEEKTKVLMVYHNIYQTWTWTGGHSDGEADLLKVAIKELKEETGVKKVIPIKEEIASLEVLPVNGHFKRGKYVSSHIHLNVSYFLQVDEREKLQMKTDENKGVKWISLEAIDTVSKEDWIKKNIYAKLNNKLNNMSNKITNFDL